MALWTYRRAFKFEGNAYLALVSLDTQSLRSELFRDDALIDSQELLFAAGFNNLVHRVEATAISASRALMVEVGYISWRSVGIVVSSDGHTIHESHPGKDIHFGENIPLLSALATQDPQVAQQARDRWERNKYSIYADIALGAAFFLVGKLTGNLTTAALVGSALGLSLVLLQRHVRVDLLGGFAVFGTLMLVISAVFSLAFQSEFMVQMKSSILGIMTAAVFFADGLLRGGAYFGERMQRYMPAPISTARMAMGLGALGLTMAGLNYAVARWLSEDAWLSYTTFFDMPVSIALAYAVYFWARRGAPTDSFSA